MLSCLAAVVTAKFTISGNRTLADVVFTSDTVIHSHLRFVLPCWCGRSGNINVHLRLARLGPENTAVIYDRSDDRDNDHKRDRPNGIAACSIFFCHTIDLL